MYLSLFFSLVIVSNLTLCVANGAPPSSLNSPCKIYDIKCLENGLKSVIPQIVIGMPELGIESSDPQFLEIIEGNISGLKYVFYNSTISGYAKCKIMKLKFRDDLRHVNCEANCPYLSMSGDYEISGQLLSVPVEGKGHFNLESAFILTSEYDTEKIKNSDTKSYMRVKNFKLKSEPLSLKFNFENLFDGQKDLADAVHEFSQKDWREITELLQNPIWNASFKKMIKNINKFLEYFALDDTPSS